MPLNFTDSKCPICQEPLETRPVMTTSGCAFKPEHRLYPYCDAPIHLDCMAVWPDRVEFSDGYYQQRRSQYLREDWWILAETPDWFLGYIPAWTYNSSEADRYLVEIRVRDWPIFLWGSADGWTEFMRQGWREHFRGVEGAVVDRAREVIGEISAIYPGRIGILTEMARRTQVVIDAEQADEARS